MCFAPQSFRHRQNKSILDSFDITHKQRPIHTSFVLFFFPYLQEENIDGHIDILSRPVLLLPIRPQQVNLHRFLRYPRRSTCRLSPARREPLCPVRNASHFDRISSLRRQPETTSLRPSTTIQNWRERSTRSHQPHLSTSRIGT